MLWKLHQILPNLTLMAVKAEDDDDVELSRGLLSSSAVITCFICLCQSGLQHKYNPRGSFRDYDEEACRLEEKDCERKLLVES